MREIGMLGQLRPHDSTKVLLGVRLQTESAYPVRHKPLGEVKNQKNKKYIASKREMELKVPKHEPANRSGAVVNREVRELKGREEHEPTKVESGHRGLLQTTA
jgi:hypothetical protein